jgi:serine phosphatase RsbU (regulator of sigma subunit)/membrane-associated protease RseP (regulator of RpoE activity)
MRQLLRASLVNYIVRNRDIAGAEMTLFERYPVIARPLYGLLAALLGAAAILTIVNYAGSPTDENLFADMPRPMSLYVMKPIPAQGDTIRAGDLIVKINGITLSDSSALVTILKAAAGDSILKVTTYRPSALSGSDLTVRRRDIPDTVGVFLHDFIAVTDVTRGGASDRAGLKVGDVLLRINGETFKTALDADQILRRGQTGKSIVYEALRDGETLRLDVTLARFGMPLPLLIFSVSGMFMMGVGGFIALKRPRIRAARVVGLGLLLSGFFVAAVAVRRDINTNLFVQVRDLMRSTTFFPKERPDILSKRWIPWVYGGLALAIFALIMFKQSVAANAGLVALILFHIVAAVVFRKGATAEQKKMGRIVNWSWGALGLYALSLLAYQSVKGANSIGLNSVTAMGVIIFGVTLSYLYVIGRYRLLDLNLRIRRNIQYSLVSVVWGMLMATVLLNIFFSLPSIDLNLPAILIHGSTIEAVDEPALGSTREWMNRFALIGIGTAAWYLLWRIRKEGQKWIDRKYYRTRYDYRQAVSELTEVLATKLSMADLGAALTGKIAELVRVKRAGVFFFQSGEVSSCRVGHGIEQEAWDVFCTIAEKSLFQVLGDAGEHIHVDYLPPALKEAFRKYEFYLIVPVRSRRRLLGAIVLGEKLSEATYRREDYEFLAAAAVQSAMAMENAFLYEELAEKERMKHELGIARRIQLASLPQKTPVIQGLEIAGVSIPAMEVGGDFFDYLNGSTGHLTVVVGDVSGKGTSAALYMSKIQGILRSLHGFGLSPADLFIRANRLLCADMEKSSFVTAVGAAFDPADHSFVLARAGHLPLYHFLAAEGRVVAITPRGLGLGLNNAGVFSSEIEEKVVRYSPGDVLLFVTDGVTEAHNREGELFGEDRLMDLLAGRAGENAAAIRDAVIGELASFSDGAMQHDDETIVVIKGL